MKIAVTGAAGRQVLPAIYDFIENEEVEKILLIDVNDKALDLRIKKANSDKVSGQVIDAKDISRMAAALADYDVVLNGTTYMLNLEIMEACLEAKTNYTDFGGFYHRTFKQLAKHEDWKKAGITGVTGSGSAPGITNAFAKYAVDRLDTVDTVLLLDAIYNPSASFKIVPPYSFNTIIEEFSVNNYEFINGELKELPALSGKLVVECPAPYGVRNFYNTLHSEVATIPYSRRFVEKGIKNMAFKISLPSSLEERVLFLIANGFTKTEKINIKGTEVVPRDVSIELCEVKNDIESAEPAAVPQDKKLLRVEVTGTRDGRQIKYQVQTDTGHHPWGVSNGHFSVGFPAAVTTRILGGRLVREKGFFSTEDIIPTDIYFKELKKRGINVTVNVTEEI